MTKRDILYIASIVAIVIVVLVSARYETIHEAKEIINKKLNYIDGARYRNISRTSTGTICGEVNGKNKNGEYQGFRFFYISDLTNNPTVWIDSQTVNLAKKMCNAEKP